MAAKQIGNEGSQPEHRDHDRQQEDGALVENEADVVIEPGHEAIDAADGQPKPQDGSLPPAWLYRLCRRMEPLANLRIDVSRRIGEQAGVAQLADQPNDAVVAKA